MRSTTPVSLDLASLLGEEALDSQLLSPGAQEEELFLEEGSSWSSSDEHAVHEATRGAGQIEYLESEEGDEAAYSEEEEEEEEEEKEGAKRKKVEDPLGVLQDVDWPQLEGHEEELLLTSAQFDPVSVFTRLHGDTTHAVLESAFRRLKASSKDVRVGLSGLQDGNFESFSQTKASVSSLHANMMELDVCTGGRATQKLAVTAQALSSRVGSALKSVQSNNKKIRNQQKLLRLVKRFESVYSLPSTLRGLIEQHQFAVAIREHRRATQQLTGSTLESFQLVLREVDKVMAQWKRGMRQTLSQPFVGASESVKIALRYAGDDALHFFVISQCELLQDSISRASDFPDLCAILTAPLKPLSAFLSTQDEASDSWGPQFARTVRLWSDAVQLALDLREDDVSPDPLLTEEALAALRELRQDASGEVGVVLEELAALAEKLLLRGVCVRALIDVSTLYTKENWAIANRTHKITLLPEELVRVLSSVSSEEMRLECVLRFADSLHHLATVHPSDLPCNRHLLPFRLLPLYPRERSLFSDKPPISLKDDSVERRLLLTLSNSIYTRSVLLVKEGLSNATDTFASLESLIRLRYVSRNSSAVHEIVKWGMLGEHESRRASAPESPEPSDWVYTVLHYMVFVHSQVHSLVPSELSALLAPVATAVIESVMMMLEQLRAHLSTPFRAQLSYDVVYLEHVLRAHLSSHKRRLLTLRAILRIEETHKVEPRHLKTSVMFASLTTS